MIDDGLEVRQVGVVQRPVLGYASASSSGVLVAAGMNQREPILRKAAGGEPVGTAGRSK